MSRIELEVNTVNPRQISTDELILPGERELPPSNKPYTVPREFDGAHFAEVYGECVRPFKVEPGEVENTLQLVLVRHGATGLIAQHRHRGYADFLTHEGASQSMALGAKFKQQEVTLSSIYTSHYPRAIDTLYYILHGMGQDVHADSILELENVHIAPILGEVTNPYSIVGKGWNDKGALAVKKAMEESDIHSLPSSGGEGMPAVIARGYAFLNYHLKEKILPKNKQGGTILILSHGGFLQVLDALIEEADKVVTPAEFLEKKQSGKLHHYKNTTYSEVVIEPSGKVELGDVTTI